MGACLLLAYKFNEAHVEINTEFPREDSESNDFGVGSTKPLLSTFKSSKKSGTIFSSLLEFLANAWSLGPKELFSAEWGVFVALEFKLHATPVQVAFHFKRLMKSLERRPLSYLGPVMYRQWEDTFDEYISGRERKKQRKEDRHEEKTQKLIMLQLMHAQTDRRVEEDGDDGGGGGSPRNDSRDRSEDDNEGLLSVNSEASISEPEPEIVSDSDSAFAKKKTRKQEGSLWKKWMLTTTTGSSSNTPNKPSRVDGSTESLTDKSEKERMSDVLENDEGVRDSYDDGNYAEDGFVEIDDDDDTDNSPLTTFDDKSADGRTIKK